MELNHQIKFMFRLIPVATRKLYITDVSPVVFLSDTSATAIFVTSETSVWIRAEGRVVHSNNP